MIDLWHLAENMAFSLILSPSLIDKDNSQAESAESEYGHTSLFLDYAYLKDTSLPQVSRRYRLIFDWSKQLAHVTHAIYGWGDLESSFYSPGPVVRASDLRQAVIPRLSWWNYFDANYASQVGLNRISTAGAWRIKDDEFGREIVMSPVEH